jgi:hypothetical protein
MMTLASLRARAQQVKIALIAPSLAAIGAWLLVR